MTDATPVEGKVGGRPAGRVAGADDWLHAWPLNQPGRGALLKGGVLLLTAWTAIGLAYMTLLDDGPIGDADRAAARWLQGHRTDTWDALSNIGSMLSETLVKAVLVVVVGGAMVAVWRRWHDAVLLAVVVVLEAAVFVIVSVIVGRDRPPIEQLDPPAPSGSFPSGHAAAAVAFYAGVFVVVRWHTRNRLVRALLGVVAVTAPLIVAVARVYRGMHHPIDVAAGLGLGAAALVVVRAAVAAGVDAIAVHAGHTLPERVRQLDLSASHSRPTGTR